LALSAFAEKYIGILRINPIIVHASIVGDTYFALGKNTHVQVVGGSGWEAYVIREAYTWRMVTIANKLVAQKERSSTYNDEECKLTSIPAKLYITSLNSHFCSQ